MNKFASVAGLAVAATAMTASADVLLEVDLSVVGQITITATDGLSAGSASGLDGIGVLMADFYTGPATSPLFSSVVPGGDLSSASDATDHSPDIARNGGGNGLNIWSFASDSQASFTAGSVAFTGSGAWNIVGADAYADMVAGNSSGDIFAFANTDDDISSSTNIGTWVVVPAPGSLALIGLGGIAAGRRRR